MKTTGMGLLICGMLLVVQTVAGQSAQTINNEPFSPAHSSQASESNNPKHSLVLPDLNPLDLSSAQSIAAANNQDVIVVIGARWCAPCQTMKNYILPQVAQRGGLDQLQFAYVDFDAQNETATALMQGPVVPQVVYMHRQAGQWQSLAVIPRMVEADKVMELIHWAQSPASRQPASEPIPRPMLPMSEQEH
jgi:thiol:disulfide interchange protein